MQLENEAGYALPDSVPQTVGSMPSSRLKEVAHEIPALSLDKTKEVEVIRKWLGDKNGVLSFKLDGSTIIGSEKMPNMKKISERKG